MLKKSRQLLATPFVMVAFVFLYIGCYIANGKEGVDKCKRKLS